MSKYNAYGKSKKKLSVWVQVSLRTPSGVRGRGSWGKAEKDRHKCNSLQHKSEGELRIRRESSMYDTREPQKSQLDREVSWKKGK
jgi:hypothetical protein